MVMELSIKTCLYIYVPRTSEECQTNKNRVGRLSKGSNDDFFPHFPEIKSTKDVSLDYAFLCMDLVILLRLLKSHSHTYLE